MSDAHVVRAMLQDATVVEVHHTVDTRRQIDRLDLKLEKDGRPAGSVAIEAEGSAELRLRVTNAMREAAS